MKRVLLALAVGLAMFAVVAYAAGLGVSGGGLQTGSNSVICDGDGVAVTYQNTDSDFDYDQATVAGIACSGTYQITVEVQTGGGATLAFGTLATSGPTAIVPFSDPLTTAEILPAANVYVTIVQIGP